MLIVALPFAIGLNGGGAETFRRPVDISPDGAFRQAAKAETARGAFRPAKAHAHAFNNQTIIGGSCCIRRYPLASRTSPTRVYRRCLQA